MRIAIAALLLLTTIVLPGCETKAQEVVRALQALKDFNKAHPDYQAKCVIFGGHGVGVYDDIPDPDTANVLTGKPATAEQRADYVAKTKARAAECKPLDEQYLQIQRLLGKAEQQAAGTTSKNP